MLGHPNFQKPPKWYGIKNRTVILGWASGSGFLRFGSSFCKILFCDDINTSTLRSNWHSVNGRQRTLSVTGYPEPEHQANPKGYDRTILPVPKATRIFRSQLFPTFPNQIQGIIRHTSPFLQHDASIALWPAQCKDSFLGPKSPTGTNLEPTMPQTHPQLM